MANIHTLLPSVNHLCLSSEAGNKFCCYNAGDTLIRRRNYDAKKKFGDCDYHSRCGARDSAAGRSWRLCAATDLRVVQESHGKSINAANQVPVIEIPVTCYQVKAVLFC